MKQYELSVIIIHGNRHHNLCNTLEGIYRNKILPQEIILVEIGTQLSVTEYKNLPVKAVLIQPNDSNSLPIAAARNKGALTASHEQLVFLDVDCIPNPEFFAKILTESPYERGLYMCTPRYLTTQNVTQETLTQNSIFHPMRPKVQKVTLWDDYGMFWSLCFYITASLYFELGGMDENYTGYGAEDTDFAFKANAALIPFYLTPNEVYHQQHHFFSPPLNHLQSIVANCNFFYKKWNIWPMRNHLKAFEDKNLINWDRNTYVEIISEPTDIAINECLITDKPFA